MTQEDDKRALDPSAGARLQECGKVVWAYRLKAALRSGLLNPAGSPKKPAGSVGGTMCTGFWPVKLTLDGRGQTEGDCCGDSELAH
jgi:hypothetical protein